MNKLFRTMTLSRYSWAWLPFLLPFKLSLLFLLSPAPAVAQTRTIEETIALTLVSNPIFAEAKARQEALGEAVEQARAGGRLIVSTTSGTSYDLINTAGGADLGLNARFPIWLGGRIKSSVRATRLDVDAGKERLRDVESIVIESAVAAHAEVLFAQEAVEIAEISISRLDSQIAEARIRFELGEATLTDVARLRTQRSSVVANLAEARAVLTIAKAQYLAIVGREPIKLSETVGSPSGLPSSLQQALQIGIHESPLFLEQERIADAAAARIEAERSDRLPRLEMTAGLGKSYVFNGSTVNALPLGASLGVTFDVPILTGGLVSSRIRQAKAVYRAEAFAVEARRREAMRDIESAWAQLRAAHARLMANDEGLEAAATALQGVRSEYEFGLRTTVDILLAEESLRSAQLAVVRSRSDLLITQASLLRVMGILSITSYTQ